jgi:hypothetical protein
MKKFKLLSIALAASLTLLSAKVWADDEPTQDASYSDTPAAVSVSDIEALKNRIAALEKGAVSSLKVDGLFQFWYTHDSYATAVGTGDVYPSSKNQWDAFSVKRAEISLTGALATDPKVSFKISIDPSLASFSGIGGTDGSTLSYETAANTTATTGVNPFTLVKDLYTQVAYSPYATIIIGQDKLWNALEGRTPSKDLDFNNYSNIDGTSFGNKRDLGVQLSGSDIPAGPLSAEYVVGIVQGSGQSTADNNVDKDIVGRVGLTYDKNLFVGASTYSGWEPNGVRQDIGFEGRWVYNGFKLQAEFITGSVNTNDNNAANDSLWTPSSPAVNPPALHFAVPAGQINPAGYYLQASYRLDDVRFGARWDGYNYNQAGISGGSNQELDTITLGLDWYQAKDAFKETLNWEDHLISGVEAWQVLTLQSQIYI